MKTDTYRKTQYNILETDGARSSAGRTKKRKQNKQEGITTKAANTNYKTKRSIKTQTQTQAQDKNSKQKQQQKQKTIRQ